VKLAAALCACFPLAVLLGCGGDFTAADRTNVTHAAALSGMAYGHSDGGAERALIRGAFCSSANVLERHHDDVPDAGIFCAIEDP
jgi:hypothetical protein